ncbi:MAG TPA: EI24 domain-containing protein [Spirochaetota bacterium]|nr:EI24 domain-containing protein [Spirochaetota bacterium]
MNKKVNGQGLALFASGFQAPFRALGLVRERKGLKRYFIIPFVVNIALLSALVWFSWTHVYPALVSLVPQGDAWYLALLRLMATPFLLAALTIFLVLLYSIAGSIITAPFNDPLSARVEELLGGGKHEESLTLRLILDDVSRIAANTIKLLFMLVAFNVLILFLNLVPVAGGLLYSVLSFASALFFFGFGFFDFPLERRRFVFKSKLGLLWRYRYMTMGVGLAFWVLSLVPLLGFMALNLGTIGATTLFLEHVEPGLGEKSAGGNA